MTTTPSVLAQTDRSTLRRKADRGTFDRELAHRILDESYICHVGFAVDNRPWVIPTIHARIDDQLYLHGAPANHLLRSLSGGIETCVTVTLLDGLVLARSAFHHSMNYRSVVLFGEATKVDDAGEKRLAMDALVEHVVRGRSADARPPTEAELRGTLVVRVPIAEGSVKVRSGGPIDDDEDMALDIWAGVVPLQVVAGEPVPDALLPDALAGRLPAYATRIVR